LRTTLTQLAWLWLRHQPQSALALWFEERVRRDGGRHKKTTIVALARKLLVALWVREDGAEIGCIIYLWRPTPRQQNPLDDTLGTDDCHKRSRAPAW
jgi:hypothetical protein